MTTEFAPPPKPSNNELPWVIESLLFASPEPLTVGALARACGTGEGAVRRALKTLSGDYEARGLRLQGDGSRYRLATSPGHAPYVAALLGLDDGPRLSRAALETLTIVAYKQPCTRSEIEAIRGVNSDGIMRSLELRELVEVVGQAPGPGRPNLYRTTTGFFEHFGLSGPDDLPPLPEEAEEAEIEL